VTVIILGFSLALASFLFALGNMWFGLKVGNTETMIGGHLLAMAGMAIGSVIGLGGIAYQLLKFFGVL